MSGGLALCGVIAVGVFAGLSATSPIPGIGQNLVGSPAHQFDPNNAVIAVHTRRPLVALSFDDGPSPLWTPGVLAALRANHAHATFFVIGLDAAIAPQLVRDELAAGDEVADHTWSHPHLPTLSDAALGSEIRRGASALTAITGERPPLFRPPDGDFDDRVSATVAHEGLRMIGWDTPLDRALDGHSPATAAHALLSRVRPGSILLAHDGGVHRGRSIVLLGLLLPALRRRGFTVVTVSTLLRAAAEGGR